MRTGKRLLGLLALAVVALPRVTTAVPAPPYKPAAIITPADLHKAVARHKGHVVLLHVWASWCLPCLGELPMIAKFARDMRGKGVEVVSISLDDPTAPAADKVGRVLSEKAGNALNNAIVQVGDTDDFVAGIDPHWEGEIPALFAYDRSGELRRAFVGEVTRPQLDKFVGDLLKRGRH